MSGEDDLFAADDAATPLTPEERRDLIPTYVALRRELNEVEALNLAAGERWALSRKRNVLDEVFLHRLHLRMFRFIYYVGPVDPVRDEVVGPAGPTTATRMDKFTRTMLEQTGLLGMIGKSERGPLAIEAIREYKSVYLMAVGGAAYLVAQAIKSAKVLGFPELGMEAIYEFDVKDMPVTVAVDSAGESVHITGPQIWKAKIEEGLLQVRD
jgi:tartrate/fumarate subfamily iron-sulfur-dependent hydro-lyase beta chain